MTQKARSTTSTLHEDVLRWFATGEVGISSRALACAVAALPDRDRTRGSNWPHDPDDFRRCLLFLAAVPDARDLLHRAVALGPEWARLIAAWDELEALFRHEILDIYNCFGKRAPKTYARMKELGL